MVLPGEPGSTPLSQPQLIHVGPGDHFQLAPGSHGAAVGRFATKTTATFHGLTHRSGRWRPGCCCSSPTLACVSCFASRSRGGNTRTILYWGLPRAAAAFAAEVESNRWMGLKLVAWFGPEQPADGLSMYGLPAFGGHHSEMRLWLESHAVDRIVFSHVTRDGLEMADLLQIFGDTSVPVVYAPAWASTSMHFTVDQVGNQSCIDLWGSRQRFLDRQLKRSFDLLLAGAGVLLILPLLLLIALAVRLSSPGPILFRQQRYGLDGKPLRCTSSAACVCWNLAINPPSSRPPAMTPVLPPWVPWLRRCSDATSTVTVLKGEMSLVGPRPHAVDTTSTPQACGGLHATPCHQARHHRLGSGGRLARRNR